MPTRSLQRQDTKIVYFVRHGESEGNVAPIFQPLDSPLNEKGLAQARRIARRMAGLDLEVLIGSPQPRAERTVREIEAVTKLPVVFSELFVERIKPSGIIGKPYDDPEADRIWKEWGVSLCTPGLRTGDGENFDDLIRRAHSALQYLLDRPESRIGVGTHGYFLRTIVALVLLGDALTGPAFKNFQANAEMENAGLTVLRYGTRDTGEAWRLWTYNDHAHLD